MSTVGSIFMVNDFNDALNAADVDSMMACMTEDCVFENTYPAPDGERFEGQAAVRAFWESFFRGASHPHIQIEEIFAVEGSSSGGGSPDGGGRVVMRWRYSWEDEHGQLGHIRGVAVYRMEDGLIAEKLSYVKG